MMGQSVLVMLALALGPAAGAAAAEPARSPAKYAAGERCEVATGQGRTLIDRALTLITRKEVVR